MDKKKTFNAPPNTAGWEVMLMEIPLKTSLIFHNIDNTASNGRQAIKRYYKKMHAKKLPQRFFTTTTNKTQHSFSITREI